MENIMKDDKNTDFQEKVNTSSKPEEEQVQAIKTTEFMKETIKQRPINKRKLIRKLLMTVGMAVVFGIVACCTFLIIEPIINARMNPEQEPEPVSFDEETKEEETLPEDMIADESELVQPIIVEQHELDDKQIEKVLNKMELGVNEYIALSSVTTDMIAKVSNSLVSVVSITQDHDWFNNEYNNEDVVSGVIIADNGRDYLILADIKKIKNTENLEVEFYDGRSYQAALLMKDKSTGYGIVSVNQNLLKKSTKKDIVIMDMGNSAIKNLNGSPIVVLGRPLGTSDSVEIGNITSSDFVVSKADGNYKLLTTDIYGSPKASGFMVNIKGQLMGVVDMSNSLPDMDNMICGLGISEMKRLIESMSNGKEVPYLGIYGVDVTSVISEEMDIPQGVYITKMEMDSPLLEAGIQSGDIITQISGISVYAFQELNNFRLTMTPEASVEIEVMREGPDGYAQIPITVEMGHQTN